MINELSLECPPDCRETGKQADLCGSEIQQPFNLPSPDRFWLLMETLSRNDSHIGTRWNGPGAGGENGGFCNDLLATFRFLRAKHGLYSQKLSRAGT